MSNEKLPQRCPICNTKKKNILLHIKNKETCFENIDKKIFEDWQKQARKETKRKYQTKFNQSGGHNRARKRKAEEARKLKARKEWKEYQMSMMQGKAERFISLAGETLMYLSQGRTPRTYSLRKSTFIFFEKDPTIFKDGMYERKCVLNENELHAWLKKISSRLLESVISLQKVILIPEADWINAIKTVEESPEKEEIRDNLFRLIGKLKAYENDNTKNISIPKKYNSIPMTTTKWFNNNNFTKDDEKQLTKLIEDILGDEVSLLNKELVDLLKISDEMEDLFVALAYTTYG